MGGDRIPLADRADPERGAARARRRDRAEDRELSSPPRAHDQHEQRPAADRGEERDRAPILHVDPSCRPRRARHQRTRSTSQTRPIAPARSTPSLRPRDARPASSPATANGAAVALEAPRRAPERGRDQRMEDREVLGLGHEDRGRARHRAQDARRRRPRAGVASASRAIAQVSGAAIEPMRARAGPTRTPWDRGG